MTEMMERISSRMRHSQTLRLLTVGLLVILLQIPVSMIGGQVSERQLRGSEAVEEVSSKWGRRQVLSGPVLVVPYTLRSSVTDDAGRTTHSTQARNAYFLPQVLEVSGNVATEQRRRGIFAVTVYQLTATLTGRFTRPDFSSLGLEPHSIGWDRAQLVIGISDTRAIQRETAVTWAGVATDFLPGTASFDAAPSGIHAVVAFPQATESVDFTLPLELHGSQGVYFTPFGQGTQVELQSNYPHPSFQGNWLPGEREIGDGGFTARWTIPFLGRSFPQAWTDRDDMSGPIEGSQFGVNFLDPVDHYRMAERSIKYASLFILLTFAALWLFEVRAAVRVHPIQFLMLGGALCLFYLLLLALSEHMAFGLAYALASVAVVAMVAAYGVVVLRGIGKASTVATVVALLYAYLYVLLVNEDYALLIGSIGLFAILGLIMYATRKVDWYQAGTK
ncbi:MAG TPA: cell envelope integrity protein CreD [Steroidobacteraceae bacterium]|nr:cell envelope integrity protein CreD [Steroidobacteraceae bacterium]